MPRSSLLALGLSLILAAPLAQAQHAARVSFFSEPGFRGECLVVEANGSVYDLAKVRDSRGRRWDDRIASLLVEGPVVAVLYADPRYRGERIEIREPVRDLAGRRHGGTGIENWDARASSLKVELRREVPEQVRHFRNQREVDRAIQECYLALLGRQPDRQGLEHYRGFLLDGGWSRDDLRNDIMRSSEYARRDFIRIVARCYREVLHRDPDPQGLSLYARTMREKGWSERDLMLELRRSDEARDGKAREIVERAYSEILRRKADPEGLRHYMGLMRDGWTEARVRDDLRRSDEYRRLKTRP